MEVGVGAQEWGREALVPVVVVLVVGGEGEECLQAEEGVQEGAAGGEVGGRGGKRVVPRDETRRDYVVFLKNFRHLNACSIDTRPLTNIRSNNACLCMLVCESM